MKTIKQLADELNVSKQAIQYHYNKLSDKDKQKDDKGRNVITTSVEQVLRAKLSDKENDKYKQNYEQTIDKEQQDILQEQVQILQHDKESLYVQLESKDNQIDELYKLLDQSQQLQASLQEQLKNKQLLIEQAQAKKWYQFWK